MRTLIRLVLLLLIGTLAATYADADGKENCWNVAYKDATSVAQHDFSKEARLFAASSCDQSYKVQPRRKVKIRFRARYIEYHVLYILQENTRVAHNEQPEDFFYSSCLSYLSIPSFQLRGPPSLI